MKFISNRKLSDTSCHKVYNILGYDIFIPDSYYNPIAFLKEGCPIWINYNEFGDCCIYESNGVEKVYSSLVRIIKDTLPKRRGFYCHLSQQTDSNFEYDICLSCFNEDDELNAMIGIKYNKRLSQLNSIKCGEVKSLLNKNDMAMKVLSDYFSNDEIVNKYRGLLIYYFPKNETERYNAILFGFVKKTEELFLDQME